MLLFSCVPVTAQIAPIFGFSKSPTTSPTLVQKAETAWNTATSPKTTASFNVVTGDLLVAYAIHENDSGNATGVSGGSLTWTLRQRIKTSGWTEVDIWTATATSTTSMTVSFTNGTGGAVKFGGNVLTFRNSPGVGSAGSTMVTSGAPSLSFTTASSNSAVVVVNGDWNAGDGSTRTWRLGATEQSYFHDATTYTAYGAVISNIGAAGTYNVGLSAPSGQKYSLAVLEIRVNGSADPCLASPSVGTPCDSGTIYAGQFDGGKYMVTPSGCTNSSTPTCPGGTDTLQKNWVGTGGSRVDIAGITNVGSDATASSSSERGGVTTPLIAAHASISSDSAADYCQDMVYGGFSDWYLGSKSEMAYIYCHADVLSHTTSKPAENPNCTSYGGKTIELLGFVANTYATSTESDADYVWDQNFTNGWQSNNWKDGNRYVRCIRRY